MNIDLGETPLEILKNLDNFENERFIFLMIIKLRLIRNTNLELENLTLKLPQDLTQIKGDFMKPDAQENYVFLPLD